MSENHSDKVLSYEVQEERPWGAMSPDFDPGIDDGAPVPLTRRQRYVRAPTKDQKLNWLDVILLFMNRTIGSGIFVSPSYVLGGTGSVGASILLWVAGAILSTCALMVWLELGLTLPLVELRGQLKSMPRSGGEKNYLEAIFPKPKFLTTCIYGTAFLILGNLSGNALACANYIMQAAGKSRPSKGVLVGVALGVLTLNVLLHVCSRRGGILFSHFFAIIKVLLLIAMIGLGYASADGHTPPGGVGADLHNFDGAFDSSRGRNWASYIDSFFYVMYAYSGFQQPFYVLAECRSPRKTFPWATFTAMAISVTLFLLLNGAYLCVVPASYQFQHPDTDMATLFMQRLFGEQNATAKRVMAGFIASAVFGNMLVMTFTASRVKQELAKEGIWPFSLFFASDVMTPVARIRKWLNHRSDPEYSPIPALGLHWLTSIILVLVTATHLDASTSYSVLVNVYSYVIRIGVGAAVAGALLWQKAWPEKQWEFYVQYKPWIGRKVPIPAITVFVTYAFFLCAAFAPPSARSVFSYANSDIYWYIIPAIGLSSVLWGILWWLGLWGVQLAWGRRLKVHRDAIPVKDPDDQNGFVMDSETITRSWVLHIPRKRSALGTDDSDVA